VFGQKPAKGRTFFEGGQFAEDQQHGRFNECAFFRQLFDGDAAVAQDALFAVHEGDGRLAGAGIAVAGIESQQPGVLFQGGDVDADFAFAADQHGQFDGKIAVFENGGVGFGHGFSSGAQDAGERPQGARGLDQCFVDRLL